MLPSVKPFTRYRISSRVAYYVNTENEQSLSRRRQDLSAQFAAAEDYIQTAIREAELPETEKAR